MTYLQLIVQTLKFSIKEQLDEEYYEYWGLSIDDDEKTSYYRKQLAYLTLTKLNTVSEVNPILLLSLEKDLTEYDISFDKIFRGISAVLEQELDFINSLEGIELEEYEEHLLSNENSQMTEEDIEVIREYTKDKVETVIIGKPMNNIMTNVMWLLPELFFTEKGYKYIANEYKIKEEDLRNKCYEFVKDSIDAYRNDRDDDYQYAKYGKIDFDGYLFEDECDLEDEDFEEYDDEEDYENSGEFRENIIDEQYYGASGLYHAIKIITTILKFIKNNELDKLNKFISIDEEIRKESEKMQGKGDFNTLIEILYDTRKVEKIDFDSEVFSETINDKYLNYFLEDSKLSEKLTDEEIGRLIMYYFDPNDKYSIWNIKTNLEKLKMRKFPRPHIDSVNSFTNQYFIGRNFVLDDKGHVLLNADIMFENRNIRTIVFDDNDETYIPNCIVFEHYICDCKENLKLTTFEEWEKLYNLDKPVVFINTSYMFEQFELVKKQNDDKNGVYLWAEYFFELYKNKFWLKDKSKFIFLMSIENIEKMIEYKGLITDRVRPYFLQKIKKEKSKSLNFDNTKRT